MPNNIPYGYRLEDGKVIIHEVEGAYLREICNEYLSGLSFAEAARKVGINKPRTTVNRMLQNPRYLGSDSYPAIIDQETFNAIEAERQRRASALGLDHRKRRTSKARIYTRFTISKPEMQYDDPYMQVEYIYSLIESVVTDDAESCQ